MFEILHRMAALFRGVMGKLIEEYRQAPVRHADETGWRTDGRSGYAWLFASAVEDLAEEFPGQAEVTAFTSTLIPLLAEAMHLGGRPLADADYSDQARPLRQQIVDLVEQPATHSGAIPVCVTSTPSPRLRDYSAQTKPLASGRG